MASVFPCQAVSGSVFWAASPELGDTYIYQAQHFQCVASKCGGSLTAQRLDVARYCTLINNVTEVQQYRHLVCWRSEGGGEE